MKDYNILQLQELMNKEELSAVELVQYYLTRIDKYDNEYNSIFEINNNAIKVAKELDLERRAKGKRSLLHGIPVLLKDNININSGDNLHTTAGSIVLSKLYANYDASIVKKLKDAGAIILGKTNLSEFANFISEDSPNGFSALSGQVKNPYGKFDVGGSSSGSGVAIALDFCQVAIGTETSGSIISPASSNSVVGVKPTVGLVSRHGIIPISWTQDIAGPLTRNTIDAAITLDIIRGKDINDKSTLELNENQLQDYLSMLDKRSLVGAKIGVPKGFIDNEDNDTDTLDVFQEAIEDLKKLGAEMIEIDINKDKHIVNWDVLFYEFPIALSQYLQTLGSEASVKDLEEIVKFNKEDIEQRVPYDQRIFERCLELQKDYQSKYSEELINSLKYGKEIDMVIDKHNLDALIFVNTSGADIAARVGYPSVTVPAGYTKDNKPVGITFTATSFTEDKLLSYAYAYEVAYRKRPEINLQFTMDKLQLK